MFPKFFKQRERLPLPKRQNFDLCKSFSVQIIPALFRYFPDVFYSWVRIKTSAEPYSPISFSIGVNGRICWISFGCMSVKFVCHFPVDDKKRLSGFFQIVFVFLIAVLKGQGMVFVGNELSQLTVRDDNQIGFAGIFRIPYDSYIFLFFPAWKLLPLRISLRLRCRSYLNFGY